ncbi:MAG: NADH-quinone oxidoreductase subunit I [Muribaculaceae bacterium]|nr:NADH-quinone oxidoreductase subunit I [Muribaculaceae bacterium]
MNIKEYFSSLVEGTHSLIKGMEVTGKELFTKKVTEQYPENRAELKIPERFRATLQFIYDDEGYHKCIACKTCERNCPNGTIQIITRMVDLPNGKKKMKLDKYMYDLGSCTFCGLCVSTCPTDAIEFSNDFEQAVFRREALLKQLNYLPEKEKPAPEPKPAPAPKPEAAKPAAQEPKPEPKVEEPKAEQPKVEEPKDVQPNVEQKETE